MVAAPDGGSVEFRIWYEPSRQLQRPAGRGVTRMRISSVVALFLWLCVVAPAVGADKPQVVELWPGKVPDEPGTVAAEKVVMSPVLDRKQVEVTESTRML